MKVWMKKKYIKRGQRDNLCDGIKMSIIILNINIWNTAIKNISCQSRYQMICCFKKIHLKYKNTKCLEDKKRYTIEILNKRKLMQLYQNLKREIKSGVTTRKERYFIITK